MGREEWYRAPTWTAEQQELFESKLKRARKRVGYMRVQGSVLAGSDKRSDRDAGKKLLRRAIAEGTKGSIDSIDYGEGYWAMFVLGKAEERHGNFEAAAAAYRGVHEARESLPGLRLPAALHLAALIAKAGWTEKFAEANALLDWTWERDRPIFRNQIFDYCVARARIASGLGNDDAAAHFAGEALAIASVDEPQLPRHPTVGLVEPDQRILREMRRLAGD
jgi:hypothetical protein